MNGLILVTGSRYWTDYRTIYDALYSAAYGMPDEYPSSFITVIHGAARGADTLAGQAAKALGFSVKEYPADWKKYGTAAGVIRNQQMLDDNNIELCLVFKDNLNVNSRKGGTEDMVRRVLNYNEDRRDHLTRGTIEVREFHH